MCYPQTCTFSAKPIRVAEVHLPAELKYVAISYIDLISTCRPAGVNFHYVTAREVIDIISNSGAVTRIGGNPGSTHAVALGVVDVGGRVPVVHLNQSVFRVVGVGVH